MDTKTLGVQIAILLIFWIILIPLVTGWDGGDLITGNRFSLRDFAVSALILVSDERSGGLPPLRPRARAEASPALVSSVIISRSNSANAAKMWNVSFPC